MQMEPGKAFSSCFHNDVIHFSMVLARVGTYTLFMIEYGVFIVPRQSVKLLVWDATNSDTFAALNIGVAVKLVKLAVKLVKLAVKLVKLAVKQRSQKTRPVVFQAHNAGIYIS